MKRTIIILVLIMMLWMAGCTMHRPGSPGDTGFTEAYCIVSVNIPYADNTNYSRWDTVSLLEQDAYGRRYFVYTTYSVALKADIEFHVICQKTDGEEYYYYPDHCYIAKTTVSDAFTDADIAAFKEQNDWALPLADESMLCVTRDNCQEVVVFQNTLTEKLMDHLNLPSSYTVLINSLEKYSDHEQMFFVQTVERNEAGESMSEPVRYIVVYDTNSENPIVFCSQIAGDLNCQDEVHALRTAWLADRNLGNGSATLPNRLTVEGV